MCVCVAHVDRARGLCELRRVEGGVGRLVGGRAAAQQRRRRVPQVEHAHAVAARSRLGAGVCSVRTHHQELQGQAKLCSHGMKRSPAVAGPLLG